MNKRYSAVLDYFRHSGISTKPELIYSDAFSLLVAVVLSAQCTDRRVNMVTPALMAEYPTPADMADASVDDIFSFVRSVSYPNAKAAHLKAMSEHLVSDFHGKVPGTLDELVSLPGVGRKTANVMLAVWFHLPAMPVDTHVFRVANRIGLTNNSRSPLETEKTLLKNIPPDLCADAHHWLLLHGRYTCLARNPKCDSCGLTDFCKSYVKK